MSAILMPLGKYKNYDVDESNLDRFLGRWERKGFVLGKNHDEFWIILKQTSNSYTLATGESFYETAWGPNSSTTPRGTKTGLTKKEALKKLREKISNEYFYASHPLDLEKGKKGKSKNVTKAAAAPRRTKDEEAMDEFWNELEIL